MFFHSVKFLKLPNGKYSAVLFACKKIYGNIHGVRKGVIMDFEHQSFITLARWILKKHSKCNCW